MDPEPSDGDRNHNAMTLPMLGLAQSERWSTTASSTFIDTQSEPAGFHCREADKIRRRAASGREKSLSAKLESGEQCANNSVAGSRSRGGGGSKASRSRGSKARPAAGSASRSKDSSVGGGGGGTESRKSTRSRRSSPQSAASSVPARDSVASTTRSKKSSRSRASSSSSSKQKQLSRALPSVVEASSGSDGSSNVNPSSGSSQGYRSAKSNAEPCASYRRRGSRDPEEIILDDGRNNYGHNSYAMVPAPPPPRPPPSGHRLLDPPSGSETSTSSSEDYDPPPAINGPYVPNPGYSEASSYESFAYVNVYAPKDTEALALWKEQKRGEDESTTQYSQSIMNSCVAGTTLPSRSDRGSYAVGRSRSRGSADSSESSRGCSRIEEGSEEESSYSSGEAGTHSGGEASDREASGLSSLAEQALVVREDGRSVATSARGEDEDNAAALVLSSCHGGVDSRYGVEDDDGDGGSRGAIVEADKRYLARAVDNLQAIVPMDSNVYEAYDHTFVTCPEHLRFRFLYTFLKKNLDKKVMIFFSTSNSAKFHAKLLAHFHVPALTMHGQQTREKFVSRFFKFSEGDAGILCTTDAAGRDLDIPPSVDWVVQFEPPDDPSEYILRVARISCDSDRVGRSLLFLNPGEQGFLKYYHSASIPVSEFEIPRARLADVQRNIEYHVNENERLLRLSRDAHGSYLIAYASHGFRDVYNVHDLNKSDVASAFGLVGLPSSVDDQTLDTETLAVGLAPAFGGGGEGMPTRSGGGGGNAKTRTWQKEEKQRNTSWMRGEKSWPHCQIKLHPKFKEY